MQTAEHLQRIRTDGFTVIERLIDQSQIDTIKQELAPWLHGEHYGRNDFEGFFSERVYALLAKTPSVAQLVEHPGVLAIVDELLPRRRFRRWIRDAAAATDAGRQRDLGAR